MKASFNLVRVAASNERCPLITELTEVGYTTFLSIEPLLEPINLAAAGAIELCIQDTNKFPPDDYQFLEGGQCPPYVRFANSFLGLAMPRGIAVSSSLITVTVTLL